MLLRLGFGTGREDGDGLFEPDAKLGLGGAPAGLSGFGLPSSKKVAGAHPSSEPAFTYHQPSLFFSNTSTHCPFLNAGRPSPPL